MTTIKTSLVLAIKEHLLEGNPITQLESICLFGVADITPTISDLRREGYKIESKRVPYVRALRRINERATLSPPANLPVKEITLTEYVWCGL
jgi:hypothetical protein